MKSFDKSEEYIFIAISLIALEAMGEKGWLYPFLMLFKLMHAANSWNAAQEDYY